jgi:hypothetical protein
MNMVTYVDVYWVGRFDAQRSTSGASLYLGDCMVYFLSKR